MSEDIKLLSKQPKNSPLKQQQLPAWQPIITPKTAIYVFFLASVFFLPIGGVLFATSARVQEYIARYDDVCTNKQICYIEIDITQDMKAPIYFYYQLDNYYQNHRRYMASKDIDQLRGGKITNINQIGDCAPFISINGSSDLNNAYFPCGIIAHSQFNDSFILLNNGVPVAWDNKGIAWKSDVDTKFHKPPNDQKGIPDPLFPDLPGTWNRFQNEEFIVWMRTAALPTFKKLHRIIKTDLLQGTYQIAISNVYNVTQFGGKKSIVISTSSWMGGKNNFIGITYLIMGALCFFLGIVFLVRHLISPRKLGDTRYLNWKN